MQSRTFTIIKPNAVAAGNTGKILDMIIGNGFNIVAMKLLSMSRNDAAKFYRVHRGREFYEPLIDFMTSGPSVVAILEKKNAIADYRKLVGNTDPLQAEEGTIRKLFAENTRKNAVHASDSEDNARQEWQQFFAENEIMDCEYCGHRF